MDQEQQDNSLRRVLFELSRDEKGRLEWHLDRDLTPEGLLMLSGALEFAREEVHSLLQEVMGHE